MTDTRVNPNLFGSAAERRAFRDELGTGIGRFIPPELRPLMGFVAEATPSAAVERAGAASMRAVQPGRTGMERLGDVGEVLSETAGVVAPAMVAGRAAMPAAEAAQEAFMGVSVPARAAAETAFERLNQPGLMPETLYSGIDPQEFLRSMRGRRDAAEAERLREDLAANDQLRAERGLPPLNPVPRTADPDALLAEFASARDAAFGDRRDMSFEELMALSERQAAARRGVVEALSGAPTVRLFDRNDRAVVVGPGMGPGEEGRFRVTYFDADRQPSNHTVYETKEEALNAALREGFVSRTAARGPAATARGVSVEDAGQGLFRVSVAGQPAGSLQLSPSGNYMSSAFLNPEFTGRRYGMDAYDLVERQIGRRLVPSPLGLSANAVPFWQRRLGQMSQEERVDVLQRAYESGIAAGAPERDILIRLSSLLPRGDDLFAAVERSKSAVRGPEPENFAQGGAVMMRSSMPEQIHQGVGSLSEVARRMFGGGPVQYMQAGGPAVSYEPRRGGDFDTFATGSDLAIQMMREARDPMFYGDSADQFLQAVPFGDAYYGEYALSGAREDVGAPRRTEPGMDFFGRRSEPAVERQFEAANIRDMVQLLRYLESVPEDQLSARDRALRDEIPAYLASRTGM